MGFVANALGAGANRYKARGVDVLQGTTTNQIGNVYRAGQDVAGQQQNFADYLASRGQQTNPLDFSAAQATLGTGNELLGDTMAAARGEGPNPALEQLRQTTAENAQRAAGMIASARGVSPAMAARVAAQTGAQANQQAAGQGATLAAQQQIAARNQASQMVGQQASQQAGLTQAQEAAQQARLGMTAEQLAGMGAQNLQQQQIQQAALANYNNARVGQNNALNQVNAGVAAQNTGIGAGLLGGLLSGAGAALGAGGGGAAGAAAGPGPWAGSYGAPVPGLARGGPVPGYANGGEIGPRSALGRSLSAAGQAVAMPSVSPMRLGTMPDAGGETGAFTGGHALGSGLAALGKSIFSEGGQIPGRASVSGDSERNDTVPIMASPGEFVVRREVAQQPGVMDALNTINDDPGAARDFVKYLVARDGQGFERVVKARGAKGAKKMSEGGEVEEDSSIGSALVRWWNSKTGDEQASKDVAEETNKALPEALSARKAVLQQRSRLQRLDEQTDPRNNR